MIVEVDRIDQIEPALEVGVNVAALLLVLLNCALDVLGPLKTLHAPVPTLGEFAANVAVPVVQIVCGEPAFDVVGTAFTVITTSLVEAVHGAFEIVQRKV